MAELFIKRRQGERFSLLTEVVRGIPASKGLYPELDPIPATRGNAIMEENDESSESEEGESSEFSEEFG